MARKTKSPAARIFSAFEELTPETGRGLLDILEERLAIREAGAGNSAAPVPIMQTVKVKAQRGRPAGAKNKSKQTVAAPNVQTDYGAASPAAAALDSKEAGATS